jgi:hypothetical protein
MEAVNNKGASMLVRSAPGMGKSTAAIAHLARRFWIDTNTKNRPSALILAPTPQLALQHERNLRAMLQAYATLFKGMKTGKFDSEVQTLFRGKTVEDERQLNILKRYGCPRVLISTPTRLLDFLSSGYESLLPVERVGNVLLDEADVLLQGQNSPTDLLMNYLHDRRTHFRSLLRSPSRKRDTANAPLRFTMLSSAERSELQAFATKVEDREWLGSRTLTMIGTSKFAGIAKPRDPFPSNVCVSLYDIERERGIDSLVEPIALEDAFAQQLLPRVPEDLEDAYEKLAQVESRIDFSAEAESQAAAYSKALFQLFKVNRTPALVMVPEEVHLPGLVDQLTSYALRPAVVDVTSNNGNAPTGFAVRNGQDKWDPLDPDTAFNSSEDRFDALLVRQSDTLGISFPGLSRIIALGFRSIASGSIGKVARLARSSTASLTIIVADVNQDVKMWEKIAISLSASAMN